MKNNVTTVKSPANIALVKYWGQRDASLVLPLNSSISMNLDSCLTTTSVSWGGDKDSVRVKYFGKNEDELLGKEREVILKVVDRIRDKYKISEKIKIVSENSFPDSAGIASSASAFSALTVALYESIGIKLSEKEMSIETRLSGSGSACRSIADGFVIWHKGELQDGSDSYAESVAEPSYWDLVDIICVVDVAKKKVSSRDGHARSHNPYMDARQVGVEERVVSVSAAIKQKNLKDLGEIMEYDAISFQTVAMMSEPPIFYWNQWTVVVMEKVREMREAGISTYYTMDAGANVHVICEERDRLTVENELKKISGVINIIEARPCVGARIVENT